VLLTDASKAAYPLQAYLFGKVVEVFTFARDRMILWGNFWAVMFFLLAITTGFSFLIIGWSAALTAVVCKPIQIYFGAIIS
jgi:ATP-binding cassette subfamily B (MDR/TAP) protein 1